MGNQMTYARRVDANQPVIVKAFRKLHFGVHITNGDWDLTVWKGKAVRLVEIRDPNAPDQKRRNKGDDLVDKGMPIERVTTEADVIAMDRCIQSNT